MQVIHAGNRPPFVEENKGKGPQSKPPYMSATKILITRAYLSTILNKTKTVEFGLLLCVTNFP